MLYYRQLFGTLQLAFQTFLFYTFECFGTVKANGVDFLAKMMAFSFTRQGPVAEAASRVNKNQQ